MRDANELRAALGAGPLLGFWAAIPSPVTAEVAAATGVDYVVVDQQHGGVGPVETTAMLQGIRAAGAAGLARVPRNDPWLIGHPLDLGALGVIVPMVESGEEAARAVAACRYAPDGERSIGLLRGAPGGGDPVCLVMVETRAALERVDEIAATPGLDGIYIGPSDLALSHGLQPSTRLEHEPVLEGIERVRAACAKRGLLCGLHCLDAADAARFSSSGGFALITIGHDLRHLRASLERALVTARRE
jgi:4-hydroxy-2-oxoheptanedioate aldolase